ncbi:MAG: glycosyltransferase [Flavobacteriales bacterium]|nr:glycosyltransferase [Flavobacteriales bacterium]
MTKINKLDISIVVPLYNEQDSIRELVKWIHSVIHGKYNFEIIFIDDGSKDDSWTVIKELSSQYEFIKAIKFRRNYGKSAALNTGFRLSNGEVVITMDADLQDSPEEIPDLYNMITKENYDLVSGWKKKRYDPISKTLPTKLFNFTVRLFSGIKLHDFNCGLKAYNCSVVKNIEVHGDMHRYIPVIAKFNGFDKISEKTVVHQSRKHGKSKYGFERFINGYLDLLTVIFVSKFSQKPMHFFGTIGTILFLVGFFIFSYIGGTKLINLELKPIVERSEFFIALVFMIIGAQMFLAGYISEMISNLSRSKDNYQIEERINNHD